MGHAVQSTTEIAIAWDQMLQALGEAEVLEEVRCHVAGLVLVFAASLDEQLLVVLVQRRLVLC